MQPWYHVLAVPLTAPMLHGAGAIASTTSRACVPAHVVALITSMEAKACLLNGVFFFNHVAASNPTPLRVPALLAVTAPLSAVRIPPGRPAAAPTLRVSPAIISTSSHGTCHGGCGVASDCVTASVIGGGETIARGSATCRHACAGRSMIAQAHKPPIIAVSVAGGGSGP